MRISLDKQLDKLPKAKIASRSLNNFGLMIYANSTQKILKVVNQIAPEHLELYVKNLKNYLKRN